MVGHQIIAELEGCDPSRLNDPDQLESALRAACSEAGATVVTSAFHHISPHGGSGVVVISESHVAVHTWPDRAYASFDIFTCGDAALCERILKKIEACVGAAHTSAQHIQRGPGAQLTQA